MYIFCRNCEFYNVSVVSDQCVCAHYRSWWNCAEFRCSTQCQGAKLKYHWRSLEHPVQLDVIRRGDRVCSVGRLTEPATMAMKSRIGASGVEAIWRGLGAAAGASCSAAGYIASD